MTSNSKLAAWLALLGRILIVPLFLFSVTGKIGAPDATAAKMASVGIPLATVAIYLTILIELGGSILLMIGYRTRLVAIVMALFTLATAVFFHSNFNDGGQLIHFLKNLSIVGGFLQIAAFGPGPFSVDARRR
ncbi:DoxX family protein [soil metagenome]